MSLSDGLARDAGSCESDSSIGRAVRAAMRPSGVRQRTLSQTGSARPSCAWNSARAQYPLVLCHPLVCWPWLVGVDWAWKGWRLTLERLPGQQDCFSPARASPRFGQVLPRPPTSCMKHLAVVPQGHGRGSAAAAASLGDPLPSGPHFAALAQPSQCLGALEAEVLSSRGPASGDSSIQARRMSF